MRSAGPPRGTHRRQVLLLFVVLLPLFFGRLAELPLPKWDDLTHVAIGREILVTGDWFTMHANGAPIWIKPPLYFWLEAALFSVLGATEQAARLPAALCGYLCAILTYLLTRRLFGRKTAFLAVLVTATSFLYVKYSRRAMIDVPVAFTTTLGAYALVRSEARERFFLLYGLAIGLGYYFKAVQGVYLVLIGPAYLVISGQARKLLSPWFAGANLAAAGLIALWAVPQALEHGDAFLRSQCALGSLYSRGLTDKPAGPLEPFLALFRVFWPWIPLSALGFVSLVRRRPAARGTVLLLCWLLVVMGLLCAAQSFFQRYLLPVVPALIVAAAVALGGLLPRRWFSRVYRNAWMVTGGAVILMQILPVPLDNRGTDQIGVFRATRYLTQPSDEIVLFKGNQWTVGQGLSFYADRRLSRHIPDAEAYAGFLAESRSRVFGIAAAADYGELKDRLGTALIERARPDGYVVFEARSPRSSDGEPAPPRGSLLPGSERGLPDVPE